MSTATAPAIQTTSDTRADLIAFARTVSDSYTLQFETFVKWSEANPRRDLSESIRDYFAALNGSTYAAGTICVKRSAVKNRLRRYADTRTLTPGEQYALDNALRRLDRDPETKAPKIQRAPVTGSKIMSENEYRRVLDHCRSDRQRCFARFLWVTGCRVSEMIGARLDQCKTDAGTVSIRIRGKGNKERVIRITRDLFDAIRSTFPGSGETLFQTAAARPYRREYVTRQLSRITAAAIGRGLSAHCFRHSFATRQIERTRKIGAVSQYLGHSSVATTMGFYVHEALSDGDLFGFEGVGNVAV